MVGWRCSWVNARFRAWMATAQSGFHHGTGGWRAIPKDCGILALAAVKMASVKCCAIALTSSKDASERCMDARNLTQSALPKIQCGVCSRAGLGMEIWMMTGKWSLPWRSPRTVQSMLGAIDWLQRAKSMEAVETVAIQMCVGSPLFKRKRLLARRSCSRSAPLGQVRLEPQSELWALKSPTMMKGVGSSEKKSKRSVAEGGWPGGRYKEQTMKEMCVVVTLTATTGRVDWSAISCESIDSWNGWQHHCEIEDNQYYHSENKHIHEDIGGVLARDVSLTETRKEEKLSFLVTSMQFLSN